NEGGFLEAQFFRLLTYYHHLLRFLKPSRLVRKPKRGLATALIIVGDLLRPDVDSLEAARTIRETEEVRRGRVPILGMTAHAMSGDRERCLAADENILRIGFSALTIRLGRKAFWDDF
ncbi:MAG: hypothetical protein JRC92_05585, partial [Deltaproteobacteria bacterium]|nr:hypothetical protein [Deltaproteobacteria bacterium]